MQNQLLGVFDAGTQGMNGARPYTAHRVAVRWQGGQGLSVQASAAESSMPAMWRRSRRRLSCTSTAHTDLFTIESQERVDDQRCESSDSYMFVR